MTSGSIGKSKHFQNRLLASAGVFALASSGVIGASIVSGSAPARAAAVVTSDLQAPTIPSFATLVERVQPAVVSVKINIEDASARSEDLSGQMNNLPPEVREFFKQFGTPFGNGPNFAQPRDILGEGSGFFVSGRRLYRHQQPCR